MHPLIMIAESAAIAAMIAAEITFFMFIFLSNLITFEDIQSFLDICYVFSQYLSGQLKASRRKSL